MPTSSHYPPAVKNPMSKYIPAENKDPESEYDAKFKEYRVRGLAVQKMIKGWKVRQGDLGKEKGKDVNTGKETLTFMQKAELEDQFKQILEKTKEDGKAAKRPASARTNMPMQGKSKENGKMKRPAPGKANMQGKSKDYLDSEEDKQKRVDEMQDRVNEAVRDYMSNLIQTRTHPPPVPQQQIIVAQPITVPVPVKVPVAVPASPLENFVSTGLELLEKDMTRPAPCPPTPAQSLRPASPAKSFIRTQTPAPARSIPDPEPPMRLTVHETVATPPRPEPPAKPRPPSPEKRPASVRPASVRVKASNVKVNDEADAEAEEQKATVAGDIKRPDEKFDRHWLTWPRTPASQSERSKTPATALYRPKNPAKLRRSKTAFDRPIFTPLPKEFVELDPRPPTGEPPTLNFIPGEPGEYGKAVPYVPAFQSWMKGASNEDKDVVYRMMKTLKAQQTKGAPSHARYVSYSEADKTQRKEPSSYGVRTSMPAFRPPEMYQVPEGQHPQPCNSCDEYLVKTWAHQVGASPEFYGIGYSRYYNANTAAAREHNDFNFSRHTFNWENPKPYAAPSTYRNVEYRPMAKHQPRLPMHKDYHHENSHFQDAQRPYRSHFIIFPDWVSENAHFKKQRQMNGHRYQY